MRLNLSTRRGWLAATGSVLLAFALHAQAAPRVSDVTISDEDDGDATASFTPDTRKIFAFGELADVAAGAKVRGEWIAVKAKGAPANYKIDTAEIVVGPKMNKVTFSLSKPTAGWPVGDYRVDFYVDGKLVNKASFKVEE